VERSGGIKMGISVKLEVFEGPLDLLLHLIDRNKVSIYDIPIMEITEQYLAYVNAMDKQDLNIVSEFLVMAATLLDIKSKMLLPRKINEDGEEVDPRQELMERLLEYKKFKYIAEELKDRQSEAGRYLFKKETIPSEVAFYEEPIKIEKLLSGITLKKLHMLFQEVIRRQEEKIDPIRSKFGKIEKEKVSLKDRMEYIQNFAFNYRKFRFRELLEKQVGKMEVVVTFLAVLELVKISKLRVEQEKIGDEILIFAR